MLMAFFTSATALRHRDFRLLWIGMLASQSGSMMQSAAILWHVYEVTHSPLALGTVGLVRVLPIIGFSMVSGVAADRLDRRKLMMAAQAGMAVCALALGLEAYLSIHEVWPIYLLAALSSSFAAFDLPARQALIPSLVPRSDLPNALSLSATMFQAASIAGPAMAGIILARYGLPWAYWLNAASFMAILAALISMSYRPSHPPKDHASGGLAAAIEGLRYVRNEPIILSSMLLDFFATFFSSATALLPIYAREILKVGPVGYGWLYAAAAIGALITGAFLSLKREINTSGKLLMISVILYGLATVAFGFSTTFLPAFLALATVGASDTVSMVIRNTIRQLNTPDSLRGRMVSVNMIFFMGGPQLGELEAGLAASWFGAPFSVVSGGIGCLVAVFFVAKLWPMLWNYDTTRTPSL